MAEGPRLVTSDKSSDAPPSLKKRLRGVVDRLGTLALQKATQAALLIVSFAIGVTLKASYGLAHETVAVLIFGIYFCIRTSVYHHSFYAAAFASLLVASGAMILLPALYGSGTGIVATRGLENLFLTVAGGASIFLGAFVFTDKDREV